MLRALNDVADVTWALEDFDGAAAEFREAARLARASRFAEAAPGSARELGWCSHRAGEISRKLCPLPAKHWRC